MTERTPGHIYVGAQNDALFLIDQPPRPAPIAYAVCNDKWDVTIATSSAGAYDHLRARALKISYSREPNRGGLWFYVIPSP